MSNLKIKDPMRRGLAIRLLIHEPDPETRSALIECLGDSNAWVRREAAEALAALGGEGVVEALMGVLNDAIDEVREASIRGLSQQSEFKAHAVLIQALGDKSTVVKKAAEDALVARGEPVRDAVIAALHRQEPRSPLSNHEETSPRQQRRDPAHRRRRTGAANVLVRLGDPFSINALIQTLGDENSTLSSTVQRALMARGAETHEAMLTALKSTNPKRRRAASQVLAVTAKQSATGVLLEALRDDVCFSGATQALSRLMVSHAVEPIIHAFEDLKSWGVHFEEAFSVAAMKALLPDSWEPLIRALQSAPPRSRERIARLLGSLGDNRAVEPLSRALTDEDPDVRHAAALGFQNLFFANADVSHHAIEILKTAVENDENLRVQAMALVAINRVAQKLPLEVIEGLMPSYLKAAMSKDRKLRSAATWGLGKLGHSAALEVLLRRLKDPVDEIRRHASAALEVIGDERAVPDLLRLAQRKEPTARYAGMALVKMSPHKQQGELVQRLNAEGSDSCLKGVIIALGRRDPPGLAELSYLLEEGTPMVRAEAARKLQQLAAPQVSEKMLAALSDSNVKVRKQAAAYFEVVKIPGAIKHLIEALADEDEYVRERAALALGSSGDPRAVTPVLSARDDAEGKVRLATARALVALDETEAAASLAVELTNDSDSRLRGGAWGLLQALL